MESYFSLDDFHICKVPVPVGYPQSQTHCTIAKYKNTYYLTSSPYPTLNFKIPFHRKMMRAFLRRVGLGRFVLSSNGEKFENPCLYIASTFNEEGFPIGFNLVEGSPLMTTPVNLFGKGSYCSDPDLFIEDDVFYIINRVVYRKDDSELAKEIPNAYIYIIAGAVYNNCFLLKGIKELFTEFYLSPCLCKHKGKYLYMSLDTNSYNDGSACKSLYLRESVDLDKWTEKRTVDILGGKFTPWHFSLFENKGVLYSIVTCIETGIPGKCYQMLGVFNNDLTQLKIFQMPLTTIPSYRGSALITEDGVMLLYTTTVNCSKKGSVSVDGRDILLAYTSFEMLLETLKNKENE